jgi:hypothetical protein
MTALAANVIPYVGLDISTLLVAPTNGDTAPCGPGVFLLVRNTNAAACTVTINCPAKVDNRLTTSASSSPPIALTTGLGLIPLPSYYADPITGLATIATYSVTSGVTVGVVRVP